jgi:superfamily II DNA or RNA helicase
MENIIYYFSDYHLTSFNNIVGCKIGSTCDKISRFKTYRTGWSFIPQITIFNIKNKICYEIDAKINEDFSSTRLNNLGSNGGTEFYDSEKITLETLRKFFKDNQIDVHEEKLTIEDIEKICSNIYKTNYLSLEKDDNKKNKYKSFQQMDKRNRLQAEYVEDILYNLDERNKVLVKAPTGFGKTVILYKTINELQPKKVLVLTPRLNLNKQFADKRYIEHLNIDYKFEQYSNGYNMDELYNLRFKEDVEYKSNIIKNISQSDENFILMSCYQSRKSLIKNIIKYKLKFNLVIFDEAHFISGWTDKINNQNEKNIEENFLLNNNDFIKNRIFTTATPIDEMILNFNIFGNLVEKVKIYELVNDKILCGIETIIKKLENQTHEYADLSKLIEKSMTTYNKRKGIVYVNTQKNAENLYEIIKKNNIINPYLYISKEIQDMDSEDEKTNFEIDKDKAVIIAVGKIGYGYDNDDIDFICFGDPRTSDIDIRQIIGRGLRWNKETYPYKILHILVPCYKKNLVEYDDNKALDAYMNYIISEYGNDEISKIIINKSEKKDNEHPTNDKKYDGDDIPIEIYNNWCTTGHNMFSKFMVFLKLNNIYDEVSYNKIKENKNWMVELGVLQTKYPKFCFRNIHPNNKNYYLNKKEAQEAYETCNNNLIIEIGKDKYRKYNSQQKLEKINELDKKIPIINFDLYYPKD